MSAADSSSSVLELIVTSTGLVTLALASALAFVLLRGGKSADERRKSLISRRSTILEQGILDEILDEEQHPGGHLTIYYGSQTGTAESFAQQLEREGNDHGFKTHVIDLEDTEDDVRGSILNDKLIDADTGRSKAIFLMATYGEGEPTDNSSNFVNLLKRRSGIGSNIIEEEDEKKGGVDDGGFAEEKKGELDEEEETEVDPKFMDGLDFAVFGLGNRQYEHYNAMGKLVNEALRRCGANEIVKLGLGDDDDDLEGDFESWKDNVLWPALKERYVGNDSTVGTEKAENTNEQQLPDCPYVVKYYPKEDGPYDVRPIPPEEMHSSTRHYFTAIDCPVTVNRELRQPSDGGSTVHLEIDISAAKRDMGLCYQTADNLGVLPVNDPSVVESVAKALKFDLDAVFKVKPAKGHEWHGALFPSPITVRDCLSRYCDLTCAPRRSDLKMLASYASDPIDKQALLRMSSKEGKAEYREKIIDSHIGIADIVTKLCRSIGMPLEHFVNVCPRLMPRYYTISSSSTVHPESIHLTVSVMTATRQDGTVVKGVCSGHLAEMVKGGTVRVFCRDSTFRLPSDPSRPIIMVGPGTGVAPMRALLQERSHQRLTNSIQTGPNVLYFGCKNRKDDYLYETELDQFHKEGTLTKLYVAYSREQKEKVYVQHLLKENGKETFDLVDRQKASIYVCGGVKMGHDVTEALRGILVLEGKMEMEDAKAYLNEMASEGRFVQELWA